MSYSEQHEYTILNIGPYFMYNNIIVTYPLHNKPIDYNIQNGIEIHIKKTRNKNSKHKDTDLFCVLQIIENAAGFVRIVCRIRSVCRSGNTRHYH